MKFYYSNAYQDSHHDYDSPAFIALCQYMMAQSEPPTLRQLKGQFPEKSFEKMLDRLLAKKVISRGDRRYRLNFPIYTTADQQTVMEGIDVGQSMVSQVRISADKVQRLCQLEAQMQYFYACVSEIPQAVIYALAHPDFHWVTVSQSMWPSTVPAFFAANQRQLNHPIFQELMRLLGDVDVDYYLDQVSVIFERMKKNKKIRSTIFLHSLQMSEIVTAEDSPKFLVPYEMACESEDTGLVETVDTLFKERLILAYRLDKTVSQNLLFFK